MRKLLLKSVQGRHLIESPNNILWDYMELRIDLNNYTAL